MSSKSAARSTFFMTTFEVRQRLQRDPVPGEVRYQVGDEHGPLARTLDSVRQSELGTAAGADPELLLPSPPSDGNDCAAVMPQSSLAFRDAIGPRVPDLSRGAARPRNSGNTGGQRLKSELRVSTRTRKNFPLTVALALQPSYSESMSTSISRHDPVDPVNPTTHAQLLTVKDVINARLAHTCANVHAESWVAIQKGHSDAGECK